MTPASLTPRSPSAPETAAERAGVKTELRALIHRLESRPTPRPPVARPRGVPPIDEVIPGLVSRDTAAGRCLVLEVVHHLDYCVGAEPIGRAQMLEAPALVRLAPKDELDDASPRDLVFLDIETTGLSGAGAIAFLVCTGRIEMRDGVEAFVLRQYLAASPDEEAGVMAAVIEDVGVHAGDAVLVTYNGRAFDAPILDGRAIMHRQRAGFEGLRHLDLLFPARRGFRGLLESCRLQTVAWELLGHGRTTTEVDGWEVPRHYFRYLRTRDARWLAPIVEHNAQDVLALAALAGRFGGIVTGALAPQGLEALAVARILHAAAPLDAVEALERALGSLPPSPARYEALMRRARFARAGGDRARAAALWREATDQPASPRLPPLVELAKHYEHHERDLTAALHVVDIALRRVDEHLSADGAAAERWRDALLSRRGRVHSRLLRSPTAGGRASRRA
jgi:uncharacterized protein